MDLTEAPSAVGTNCEPPTPLRGSSAIGSASLRSRVHLGGVVVSAGPVEWCGGTVFECVIDDQTGRIVLAFLGYRDRPMIRPGVHLWADGTVGNHRGRRIVLNPTIELLSDDD